MLRKFGIALAFLALFAIAGGHWAALQTVAWARMLAGYAQCGDSLTQAVSKTFDGAHPCPMCLKIAQAKAKEKQSPAAPAAKDDAPLKATLAEADMRPAARPERAMRYHPLARADASRRAEPPLTPPPRVSSQLAA